MKTENNLWQQFTSWEHMIRAYKSVRKGKKKKPSAIEFHANWEELMICIHEHLQHESWKPSGFRSFMVHEPKERMIEAPAYKDRIIHHALHLTVNPIFERKFIKDSYACRIGKGTHAAASAVQNHLRKARRNAGGKVYALQMDIRGYFHHIDHAILKQQIRRAISDRRLLKIWDRIIDIGGERGVGQPIGALTSQLAANIYLNDLDHFCKDDLGLKHYVRYMDDFVIIHPNKNYLIQLQCQIEKWLCENLKLSLSKWSMYPETEGVDFCGYRTWANHIRPRKRNVYRAKRRLKAQLKRGDLAAYSASLASFRGYLKNCTNGDRYVAAKNSNA
ncbi:alpha/beta hydrolase [Oceanospirillaceae bacterium ASx5O]|nr:alpha/beta hydrolase [Oceanospirillaceae bacterium ASx5O]